MYKIASGNISRIVETIRAGSPVGIALSLNESRLLVSTLQPTRTRAQVLVVDLATLETSPMTAGIGQNIGAGGIHRAKLSEVYAWAGISKTPPHGPIYKIMNQ